MLLFDQKIEVSFAGVKKFIVIFLLMVYGLSSSGMTVQFHYCCGKLKSVELKPAEPTTCKHGKHKMTGKKCCESKTVELKVKKDQKAEGTTSLKFFNQLAETRDFVYEPDSVIRIIRQLSPVAFAPPPDLPTSLFILYCVYRI